MASLGTFGYLVALIGLPVSVAVGAQLGTPVAAYGLIAVVCFVLVLASLDGIPDRWFPALIYSLSLSLMWSATMVGAHIIGSDMAGEYYVANSVLRGGAWNWQAEYGTQSSTSVVLGWLVPSLSRFLSVDPAWVFKLILPAVFALTPTVLFWVFRRQFGAKTALYSSVFFMIVPVTTLEIAQIGKAMVAEAFLAGAVYLLLCKWRWFYQLPALSACVLLASWAHYTVGLAGLFFLFGVLAFRVVALPLRLRVETPLVVLAAVLTISLLAGSWYYSKADKGSIAWVVGRVIPAYTTITKATVTDAALDIAYPDIYKDSSAPKPPTSEPVSKVRRYADKYEYQEGVVKTAVGLDFSHASSWGKAFRVVQYITQVLILLGAAFVLLRGHRLGLSAEFMAGVASSLLLLAAVVLIPQFSLLINATRFYHFALFFLAPAVVVGLSKLTKAWLAPAILLIVYFLFTSGLVFELTRWDRLDRVEMPYSVALSVERTGVVATYNQDDVDAVKWLTTETDSSTMIVGDYNGWHLVAAYSWLSRLRETAVSSKSTTATYNPTLDNLPNRPAYLFLTSWNNQHGRYIESVTDAYGEAGLRESLPLPTELGRYREVYRKGDAVVLYKP